MKYVESVIHQVLKENHDVAIIEWNAKWNKAKKIIDQFRETQLQ